MVKAGVVKPGIDYKQAYTLQFVNKGGRARPAAEELISGAAGRRFRCYFCAAGSAL